MFDCVGGIGELFEFSHDDRGPFALRVQSRGPSGSVVEHKVEGEPVRVAFQLWQLGMRIRFLDGQFVVVDPPIGAALSESPDAAPAEPQRLPSVAERILYLLLSPDQRQVVPGDLEEEYRTVIVPKFGKRYAGWWYRWQVLSSVRPVLRSRFTRTLAYAGLGKVVAWFFGRFGT